MKCGKVAPEKGKRNTTYDRCISGSPNNEYNVVGSDPAKSK